MEVIADANELRWMLNAMFSTSNCKRKCFKKLKFKAWH